MMTHKEYMIEMLLCYESEDVYHWQKMREAHGENAKMTEWANLMTAHGNDLHRAREAYKSGRRTLTINELIGLENAYTKTFNEKLREITADEDELRLCERTPVRDWTCTKYTKITACGI